MLQGAAWPPAPPGGHGVVVAGPVCQGLEWVCRGEGALLNPRLSLISGHHKDMLPPSLMNSCSRDRWAHIYSHSMAWLPSHSTVTPSPHLLITVGPGVLELEMATSFTKLLEFSGFFSTAQYIYNLTVWMRILDYSFSAPIHIPQRLGSRPPIPPHAPATCHLSGMASCLTSLAVRSKGSGTMYWEGPFLDSPSVSVRGRYLYTPTAL